MKTGVIGNFVFTGLEVKSEDLDSQELEIKIKEEQEMDTEEEVRCEGNGAFVTLGQEVNKDMGLAILQKLDEISRRLENVEKSQKMIVNHLKICSQEVSIEDRPENYETNVIINVPPELDTSTTETPSVNNSKTIYETHINGVENLESSAAARRKNKIPKGADSEADDDGLWPPNQKKQKYSHVHNGSVSKLDKKENTTYLQSDAGVEKQKSDATACRKNKEPKDADTEADGGRLSHQNQKKPKYSNVHNRSLSKLVQRCIEYDDEDEVNVVVDAVSNELSNALAVTLNASESDQLPDETEPNGGNLSECFSPLAVSPSEVKEISKKTEESTKVAEIPVFIHGGISLSNFETSKGGIIIKDCDARQKFIFPSFPKFVEPYLHGTASEKQIPNMRRVLVQEIVHYLDSNHLINDQNNMKRRWQYADLQRDLLISFPNIIREECKRRRNYKGELAALIIKISEKRRHATASSKGKV